jgi:hypothetical protein
MKQKKGKNIQIERIEKHIEKKTKKGIIKREIAKEGITWERTKKEKKT